MSLLPSTSRDCTTATSVNAASYASCSVPRHCCTASYDCPKIESTTCPAASLNSQCAGSLRPRSPTLPAVVSDHEPRTNGSKSESSPPWFGSLNVPGGTPSSTRPVYVNPMFTHVCGAPSFHVDAN